jgi:hypothetical protein
MPPARAPRKATRQRQEAWKNKVAVKIEDLPQNIQTNAEVKVSYF